MAEVTDAEMMSQAQSGKSVSMECRTPDSAASAEDDSLVSHISWDEYQTTDTVVAGRLSSYPNPITVCCVRGSDVSKMAYRLTSRRTTLTGTLFEPH